MTQTFHDHFSELAAKYAGYRPHYPAALFDFLATLAPQNMTVWDCAAGNGQATVDLAARFERVIATDASREQIASATPHPRAEYRVATAEESGLPDKSVGLVTVAQALHWFNLDKFYAGAKRVLVPGGVLAVWAYGINQVEDRAVNEVMQDYYVNVVGSYWPPERRLVEEGYRTIAFPFGEIAPPALQMHEEWSLEALLGYFSSWSATSRFIKANGRNPLEELQPRLAQVWGPRGTKRVVSWPLSLRVGLNP